MRWVHQVHHYLWGRPDLAAASEPYFGAVREQAARHTRVAQNYSGVRWPKMVGPAALMPRIGDPLEAAGAPLFDGPSEAGPWLVWEQMHPILFAELAYRAAVHAVGSAADGAAVAAAIAAHNRTVHDSADFLADFVLAPAPPADPAACLPLGPPVFTCEVESNEGRAAADPASANPTFELVYVRFGLRLAAAWRRRLGLPPMPAWEEVIARMCTPTARPLNGTAGAPMVYYPYPASSDGALVGNGVAPQLFSACFAPLCAECGPDYAATLRNTFAAVFPAGVRTIPWGSDAAMYAMAAARLGDAALATAAIAPDEPTGTYIEDYMPNGHYANGFLPVYTGSNAALLAAVAFMAGGWDGDGGLQAPGFPRDGSWTVRAEGFFKYF